MLKAYIFKAKFYGNPLPRQESCLQDRPNVPHPSSSLYGFSVPWFYGLCIVQMVIPPPPPTHSFQVQLFLCIMWISVEILDSTETGQVRFSSGAGYVSWRKGHMLCFAGQILYRTDAGHGGCWTGRKQDILDAGQDKCSAGCMQGRTDAGQVICRTWQIHCFEGSSWLLVCDWIK